MDKSMIKGVVIGGIAMVVLGAGAVGGYQTLAKPKEAQVLSVKDPAALPWKDAWDIERAFGPAESLDKASLSRAVIGVAETGTLFLVSGRDNPTSLAFLPETHMVLIAAGDVVGSYEEAWDRLRTEYGEGALPRSVNLIGGPSRYRANHRERRARAAPVARADPGLGQPKAQKMSQIGALGEKRGSLPFPLCFDYGAPHSPR